MTEFEQARTEAVTEHDISINNSGHCFRRGANWAFAWLHKVKAAYPTIKIENLALQEENNVLRSGLYQCRNASKVPEAKIDKWIIRNITGLSLGKADKVGNK